MGIETYLGTQWRTGGRGMSRLVTGLSRKADTLIGLLAEENHRQRAFTGIAVIDIGGATIVRGVNGSNRLDGYGITAQMVATARAELRRMGYDITLEVADSLLHHAEEHRAETCVCRRKHIGGYVALTGYEKQQRVHERRLAEGLCRLCGKEPYTNGAICRPCLDIRVEKRRELRARKRLPESTPDELSW
jgi:hypothetical protein